MDETTRLDGRRIWRSLERPHGSEALPEDLRPEFPDGADTPPDGLTRRTMMGLMGASLAMAGLAGCRRPVEHIVPYVDPPPEIVPGIPQTYATTLPTGTSAVGVVVESHEGRPGKIEGNELHPGSLGAASAWTQAEILRLYDPDRSRTVLRRTLDSAQVEAEGDGAGEGEAAEAPAREPTWAEEVVTRADFEEYWSGARETLTEAGGEGLAFLMEPWSSPTLSRLVADLRERFPNARYVVWSPWSEENVFAGLERATGRATRPLPRFENARTILTLDADPFLTEGDAAAQARGFSEARRPGADMARLWAVESTPTVTGAAADHRVRLESGRIPDFVRALAAELGVGGGTGGRGGNLPSTVSERIPEIARELRQAGSGALVVAGWRQPPEVHAMVHRMHQALGALGSTVENVPLRDVGWGRTRDLADLTRAMSDGEVTTLVVVGGNPVYDAPADLGFAEAMDRVETTIRLSTHVDETSRHARWHLHRTHPFEAWGDARAADGTPSVIQPLIAPLFDDATSDVELLALMAGDGPVPGYGVVRATWGVDDGRMDEDAWKQVLHDGVASADALGSEPPLEESATESPRDGSSSDSRSTTTTGDGPELVFAPSPSIFDGRYANVAWLQEAPDPLTKLTWDNAALVSPARARELGVESGDLVTLSRGDEATIQIPVLVQPGQADGTVTVALGYGRTSAGRVGNGVGVDATRLRRSAAPWIASGVTVAAAGGRVDLARTQEHWSMEGRDLVREMPLGALSGSHDGAGHGTNGHGGEHGEDHGEAGGHGEHADHDTPTRLWPMPELDGTHQWGMSIDLAACIGCNACVVACQSENNIPVVGKAQVLNSREMHWLRVDRYFLGDESDPDVVFQPMPCQHCENAPCEQVCPVAATVHDAEGLNVMVYNRCIGTRYCSNNCPYKVRRFNFFNYTKNTPELVQLAMNPDVTVRSRGVMEKCTYCLQRIQRAKLDAKKQDRPVRDGEVVPACAQTCPTRAIVFGDVADPESRVSRAKEDSRSYTLLEELRNRPRTTYLAKVRNRPESHPASSESHAAHGEGGTA